MKNRKISTITPLSIIAILVILLIIITSICMEFNDTEYTVTITDKTRVYDNGESKYLIFCELENGDTITFENTDAILRGKFNSSDIYGKLKVGKKYKLTVVGIRLPIFSTYQNIIKVKELD